ncbi:hypothetical protein EI555_015205, partial [Monodon monoceros]
RASKINTERRHKPLGIGKEQLLEITGNFLELKFGSMENANQENEKKDEKEQDANKREPLVLPLEAGEYRVPGGKFHAVPTQLHVRQPILHYIRDTTQRLGEPQARMREENMERIGEEVRELMEKLREKHKQANDAQRIAAKRNGIAERLTNNRNRKERSSQQEAKHIIRVL